MKDQQSGHCPACHGRKAVHWGEKSGFEIFGCSGCGSLYTDRVPDISEAENYDEYYTDSNLSVPDFIITRVGEIIAEFESSRETNRMLDIGFGAGTMLDVAKGHGGDAHGLEVSRPAVDQARKRGYEVFHCDLKGAGYPDNYFDVVTASEILEHLPNPEEDLAEIARVLRPGGVFWGTTPSARSISFRILKLNWSVLSPPEHIQLYSKAGARLMLTNAEFNQIEFKTYGLNPSEIVNHFRHGASVDTGYSRVDSAYQLNEILTKSPFRKVVKRSLNGILNAFQMGDSLKIFARSK